MTTPINILIADDHRLFTQGLKALLESVDGFQVIDVVVDGMQLLSVLNESLDVIVLMDINMPKLNGLDASLKISQQYPLVKVIILSTYSEGHLIQKAKQFGCKGYIVKTADPEELIEGIRKVANGEEYFNSIEEIKSDFKSDDILIKKYKLTRRELEILDLLRKELTNKEISEQLFLSIYTIETHRKNIMQKLELKTPAALLKFFMTSENGHAG